MLRHILRNKLSLPVLRPNVGEFFRLDERKGSRNFSTKNSASSPNFNVAVELPRPKVTKYRKFGTTQRFDIVLKCKFNLTAVHPSNSCSREYKSGKVREDENIHSQIGLEGASITMEDTVAELMKYHVGTVQQDPANYSSERKVFLNNLPPTITHEELARALRNCGEISTISLYNVDVAAQQRLRALEEEQLLLRQGKQQKQQKGDWNKVAPMNYTVEDNVDSDLLRTEEEIQQVVGDYLDEQEDDKQLTEQQRSSTSSNRKERKPRKPRSRSRGKKVEGAAPLIRKAAMDPDAIDEALPIQSFVEESDDDDDDDGHIYSTDEDHENDENEDDSKEDDMTRLSSSAVSLETAKLKKSRKKAQHLLRSNRSDTCCFVVLKDDMSFENINREAIRLFGIYIGGQACKVQPAASFRTLYLDLGDGEEQLNVQQVLEEVRSVLGGTVDVNLAYPVREKSCPVFVQMDFESHEHAAMAYSVLSTHFARTRISSNSNSDVTLQWNRTRRYWDLFGMSRDQIQKVQEYIQRKKAAALQQQGDGKDGKDGKDGSSLQQRNTDGGNNNNNKFTPLSYSYRRSNERRSESNDEDFQELGEEKLMSSASARAGGGGAGSVDRRQYHSYRSSNSSSSHECLVVTEAVGEVATRPTTELERQLSALSSSAVLSSATLSSTLSAVPSASSHASRDRRPTNA